MSNFTRMTIRAQLPAPAFDRVRAAMGVKDISNLSILMTSAKIIEYNKMCAKINTQSNPVDAG